jgi:hypothetical protein
MKTLRLEVAMALFPGLLAALNGDFDLVNDQDVIAKLTLRMADRLIALDEEMTLKENQKTYFKEFSEKVESAMQSVDSNK